MSKSRREMLVAAARVAVASLWAGRLRAATVLRSPYVQNVRQDRCSLLWTTKEPSQASVEVSTDPEMARPLTIEARSKEHPPSETRLTTTFFQHEAEITGLAPNTRYYYRLFSGGQPQAQSAPVEALSFQTAPAAGKFRFVVFGDSGGNTPEQYALRDRMLKEKAALVVHVGDIVYPFGVHELYQSYYFDAYRDVMSSTPFFPCPGNHDVEIDAGLAYFSLHSVPSGGVPEVDKGRYYSFDWGDCHFVSLDSNIIVTPDRARRMLDWLDADLASTRKTWKIAYWHHTPYDVLRDGEDPTRMSRSQIPPILERYGVHAVFCGHNHIFQRTHPLLRGQVTGSTEGGIVYVTSGGGGAGLYEAFSSPLTAAGESVSHFVRVEVSESRIDFTAIGVDGREVDTFAVAPRPVISRDAMVNAASFANTLAPGSLFTIFGRNLSYQARPAAGTPFPTDLGGVSVSLNSKSMPLLFVSPGQINAQVPFKIDGSATIRVTTPNGFAETTLTIRPTAPGIFTLGASGATPAIVHATDGQLVSAGNAARGGEFLSIYMTGLGEVRGDIAAGIAAPTTTLVPVVADVQVDLDGTTLAPSFAGLSPGFVGLYQVNVQVPAGLGRGSRRLTVVAAGVRSNTVTLDTA
jgi:uncharacterized protein (TIGR03437 family)